MNLWTLFVVRRLVPRFLIFFLVSVVVSGCIANQPDLPGNESSSDPRLEIGAWAPPVQLNVNGYGYEPSIVADAYGRLFVTAHKGRAFNEGDRLSSWLWYSEDSGKTWKDLPTPLQVHTKLAGIEGDLAVDADSRVYFVDTYLGDNTLSVWRADQNGVVWESSRPIHGTSGMDDRPWLVAQGSGILYYLGDHVLADHPSPEGLLALDSSGSRWWFYRSLDGGLTWSPGLALGDIAFGGQAGGAAAGMCGMDAGKILGLVAVACSAADGRTEFLLRSTDYGRSWTRIDVGAIDTQPGWLFPSVAVRKDGGIVTAWIDDNLSDDQWGRLKVALIDSDSKVFVCDVTPREATYSQLWVSVSATEDVLVNYHSAPELRTDGGANWSIYAMTARVNEDGLTDVSHTLVDPELVGTWRFSPGHFFQNTFLHTGEAFLAYQRDIGFFPQEFRADILVSRPWATPMENAGQAMT